MKLYELFEDISPEEDLKQIIQDYFISLKANGVTEIPTSVVLDEVSKRSNIKVSFGDLSTLLGDLPMIQDMNNDTITIGEKEETPGTIAQDSKETVKNMASASAKEKK